MYFVHISFATCFVSGLFLQDTPVGAPWRSLGLLLCFWTFQLCRLLSYIYAFHFSRQTIKIPGTRMCFNKLRDFCVKIQSYSIDPILTYFPDNGLWAGGSYWQSICLWPMMRWTRLLTPRSFPLLPMLLFFLSSRAASAPWAHSLQVLPAGLRTCLLPRCNPLWEV